jgi:hypothetical protein
MLCAKLLCFRHILICQECHYIICFQATRALGRINNNLLHIAHIPKTVSILPKLKCPSGRSWGRSRSLRLKLQTRAQRARIISRFSSGLSSTLCLLFCFRPPFRVTRLHFRLGQNVKPQTFEIAETRGRIR